MDEIDLTDGNTKGRHVQPQGFVPSHLAEPALRDQYGTQLEHVARELGSIRLAADLIGRGEAPAGDRAAGRDIGERGGTSGSGRRLRSGCCGGILSAGLIVALAVGIGAYGVSYAPAASAATVSGYAPAIEGPQPDPVASGITYRVTLDRPAVTLAVPFVTSQPAAGTRLHCASLWLAGSPVGYGCSTRRAFTVRASLDAAAVPVGRSALTLVDEATDAAVTATLQARRPSRFGVGRWLPLPQGQLYVSATLYAYTPAKGAWTPQQNSPVRVREWSAKRGRWVVRATLTTDSHGVFSGVVYLGEGPHIVDVDRLPGATVTGVTGKTRRFVLAPVVPIETD